MQETIKHCGDANDLAYIRDRYNQLLERKMEFEAQIRNGKNRFIAMLLETQEEMIYLDERRTLLVNKFGSVAVDNIKLVTAKDKPVSVFCMIRPNERIYKPRRSLTAIREGAPFHNTHLITI